MSVDVDFAPGPRLVPALAPHFPSRFADLGTGAPPALWVDGRLPRAGEPLVAIVGSRSASWKACGQVTALAAELARAGHPVVSGGALGIDAAAHRGALQAGGATFAVLGCGIDVVYPDRHSDLFRDIARAGGLLSEYPPGEQPRRGQFPARNRLVAALAQVVVVGECRARSGALITARLAARLGRRVCALPGSPGADGLLARGVAWPVRDAADVVKALAGVPPAPQVELPGVSSVVSDAQDSVGLRRLLNEGPLTAEEVSVRLGRGLGEVLGLLCEGELEGWVLRRSGGRFEVHRGH